MTNKTLNESEQLSEVLIANIPDCSVFLFDSDLRYLKVGGSDLTRYGYDPTRLIGKTLWEVMPEEFAQRIVPYYHKALSGAEGSFELQSFSRPGIFQLIVRSIRNEKGEIYAGLLVAQNVTERNRNIELLAEKQHFIEAVTQATPALIYVYDLKEQRNIYSNQEITSILGYSVAEVISMGSAIFPTLMHPDDLAKLPERMANISKTSNGVFIETEYRMRHRNGQWRWLYSRDVIFKRDEDGTPTQTLGFCQDITERKEAEEAMRALNVQLVQSNLELEEFAGAASHDLQEPLRKILNFGSRLRSEHAGQLDEQGLSYLARIQRAAERMQLLINDLLSLSQVTTKATDFEVVDLNNLLRSVLDDLEVRLEQTGGRVEYGGLPIIEGEPTQLHQLFQNLISNALKYHRPDAPPLVKVEAVTENPFYYRIVITDNGIGFDQRYAERIFGVFQRLHGKNSPYEGTGMGLALCRKIVARHGGSLTAKAEPNNGATFILKLPVKQSSLNLSAVNSKKRRPDTGK